MLPLRSCQGAVLCRTWDREDVCAPGGNPLAAATSRAVLRAFGAAADLRGRAGAPPQVTLLTREDTARSGEGQGKGSGPIRSSNRGPAGARLPC